MTTVIRHGEEGADITRGPNASANVPYKILDATDEPTARAALEAAVDSTFDGLYLHYVRITGMIADTDDCFEGEAVYGLIEFDSSSAELSFDTTGKTTHISQSLATAGSYAETGTAPDFGGAIGVTKDAVQGVDIVVPGYAWSESYVLLNTTVTQAYRVQLARMTGKTNDDTFRGFDAGEVLFLGARGQVHDLNSMKVEFLFEAAPNATDLEVGNITGISKLGHQYLWARYREVEDTTANAVIQYPKFAYVETVYYAEDLSLIGIGT